MYNELDSHVANLFQTFSTSSASPFECFKSHCLSFDWYVNCRHACIYTLTRVAETRRSHDKEKRARRIDTGCDTRCGRFLFPKGHKQSSEIKQRVEIPARLPVCVQVYQWAFRMDVFRRFHSSIAFPITTKDS